MDGRELVRAVRDLGRDFGRDIGTERGRRTWLAAWRRRRADAAGLPRRGAERARVPGLLIGTEPRPGGGVLRFARAELQVRVLTGGVVFWAWDGAGPTPSYALTGTGPEPDPRASLEPDTGGGWRVVSERVTVAVSRTGAMEIRTPGGTVLRRESPPRWWDAVDRADAEGGGAGETAGAGSTAGAGGAAGARGSRVDAEAGGTAGGGAATGMGAAMTAEAGPTHSADAAGGAGPGGGSAGGGMDVGDGVASGAGGPGASGGGASSGAGMRGPDGYGTTHGSSAHGGLGAGTDAPAWSGRATGAGTAGTSEDGAADGSTGAGTPAAGKGGTTEGEAATAGSGMAHGTCAVGDAGAAPGSDREGPGSGADASGRGAVALGSGLAGPGARSGTDGTGYGGYETGAGGPGTDAGDALRGGMTFREDSARGGEPGTADGGSDVTGASSGDHVDGSGVSALGVNGGGSAPSAPAALAPAECEAAASPGGGVATDGTTVDLAGAVHGNTAPGGAVDSGAAASLGTGPAGPGVDGAAQAGPRFDRAGTGAGSWAGAGTGGAGAGGGADFGPASAGSGVDGAAQPGRRFDGAGTLAGSGAGAWAGAGTGGAGAGADSDGTGAAGGAGFGAASAGLGTGAGAPARTGAAGGAEVRVDSGPGPGAGFAGSGSGTGAEPGRGGAGAGDGPGRGGAGTGTGAEPGRGGAGTGCGGAAAAGFGVGTRAAAPAPPPGGVGAGPAPQWLVRSEVGADARFFGLGGRAGGPRLRDGAYRLWNTDPKGAFGPGDDPLYLTMPVQLVVADAGTHLVFHDNTWDGRVILREGEEGGGSGQDRPGSSELRMEGGPLRCWVFVGTPARVLQGWAALTGAPAVPPEWALGYQHARWGFGSAEEVRRVVAGYVSRGIALSAVHLDIDHYDGHRVFTVDEEKFPDLPELAGELREQGVRLVSIVDPAVKTGDALHAAGLGVGAGGAFVRDAQGREVRGEVWPGECAYPDFTDPAVREWWGGLYEERLGQGFAGFWHDMNEPVSFTAFGDNTLPRSARHAMDGAGGDHREAHNVYALAMARAGWEGLTRLRPAERPFLFSRSGWAGMQRYGGTWSGDVESSWEGLRASLALVLGMGLCGVPYSGPDVGGFGGSPSPELYVRWLELGSFLPLFRTHSAIWAGRREPWEFGAEAEARARAVLAERERLRPYFVSLAHLARRTGAPYVRPVWWGSPEDRRLRDCEDAFLLGDALLVAPVLEHGSDRRAVRLPRGRWYDTATGAAYEGPGQILLDAPLGRTPVLARAGAILPIRTTPDAPITLEAWAPARGATGGGLIIHDPGPGPGTPAAERYMVRWAGDGVVVEAEGGGVAEGAVIRGV